MLNGPFKNGVRSQLPGRRQGIGIRVSEADNGASSAERSAGPPD